MVDHMFMFTFIYEIKKMNMVDILHLRINVKYKDLIHYIVYMYESYNQSVYPLFAHVG